MVIVKIYDVFDIYDKKREEEFKKKNEKEVEDAINKMREYKRTPNPDPKVKNQLFCRCKSIVDHYNWYSEDQRQSVLKTAEETLSLTKKQKHALSYSSILIKDSEYSDSRYDGANSDEDCR